MSTPVPTATIGWSAGRAPSTRPCPGIARPSRRRTSSPTTRAWSRTTILRPKGPTWAPEACNSGLSTGQLLHQPGLAIDLVERFGGRGGRNHDRAVDRSVVAVVAAQRMDVAVEGGAQHL